jgi:DNA-binding CsgD family transcriptional regulator
MSLPHRRSVRSIRAKDLLSLVDAFSVESERANSIAELCEAVAKIVAPLGYTALASGRLGQPNPGNALHFAIWKPEWMELYLREGFVRFDPVPMWAIRSGSAVTCDELRGMLPKEHPGHAVFAAGVAFGYAGGYIVPQRASDNAFGLVSFVGARDPQTPNERAALRMLASITFERAEILTGHRRPTLLPMPPPSLTVQERKCLIHLIGGRTATQIAQIMRITEATVRFHSNNLRKKTCTSNLAELTAFAISSGIVPNT